MLFIKRNSYVLVFFTLALFIGLFILFQSDHRNHYTVVTIKDGDTIWSISEKYASEKGLNTAKVVKLIEKENQLHTLKLKNGDELKIPSAIIRNDESTELAFDLE